jgi:MFS family permease
MRCAACAQMRPLPTYEVSAALYLRAALAGLAVALLGGMVVSGLLRGLFAIWLAPVFGLLVGEAVTRAANLRRGPWLQVIAAVAVLLGAVFGPALPAILAGRPVDAALLRTLLVAGGDLWVGIFGLLAVFFAVQRVR